MWRLFWKTTSMHDVWGGSPSSKNPTLNRLRAACDDNTCILGYPYCLLQHACHVLGASSYIERTPAEGSLQSSIQPDSETARQTSFTSIGLNLLPR